VNTTINVSLVAVVTAVICAGAPSPASAQVNGSQRPYKALFGGSAADPDVRHSFDVSVSVLEGYDDNAVEGSGTTQSLLNQTGLYTGMAGNLSYAWHNKSVQVGATAGTDMRYYADESEFIGVSHSGGFGFSAALGPRTNLSANQSVSYSPAYLYGVFTPLGPVTPGEVIGVGDPLGDEHVYIYDTSVNFTRGISPRGSIEALGTFRYSDYNQQSTSLSQDLRSYSVGGRYRHNLTRYAALRLGYVYRKGSYGLVGDLSRPAAVHDIDVGVDYKRPLSLTRRTTVDFGVGSSIVNMPAVASTDSSLQYRVVGDLGLTHQMGRTWSARVAYNRGVGFTEGFAQPTFSDAVTGSVSGFFSRRVDFTAGGGLSIGDAGLSAGTGTADRGFRAYTGSARVRYGLGAMWALFGEYSYYKHDLGDVLIVAQGVPPILDRNSVRVGLTLWVPLLRR
jgi:hypothetical protein